MTRHHRFATLALAAAFAASACGRGDEPPLCGQDVCVTSSSSERVEARFDVDGTVGTARLDFSDTAIDVTVTAGDRVLLQAAAVRGPSHYEGDLILGGASFDAARNGSAESSAALRTFLDSGDGAVVRHVLDRLQVSLEPRDRTADVGQLAGAVQLALDEVGAFLHGGQVEYGPPDGGSCIFCIYLDKGCFCISCTIPQS